ncbi:MAG: hypothetical protein KKA30_15930 [Alphaproteobacteria bacterium]|nr:hypothetical protein [Alphaproteobacteria bacterium]
MPAHRHRDVAISLAALVASLASPALACTIILTPKSERASERVAFRKANVVVTVDAASESYMPVPGPSAGTLRVGVGRGRVVKVHKGPSSLQDRMLTYLVADGEDSVSCPALGSARPGRRYKLYLAYGPGSGPPTILFRNPFFD